MRKWAEAVAELLAVTEGNNGEGIDHRRVTIEEPAQLVEQSCERISHPASNTLQYVYLLSGHADREALSAAKRQLTDQIFVDVAFVPPLLNIIPPFSSDDFPLARSAVVLRLFRSLRDSEHLLTFVE